jgi:ATP-dependent phosphofructokinase / diphosphate-dependent phosphofructokinase
VPGGVASHLAETVAQRLKVRCRWEKPGLCGRASMLHVSPQDLRDAEQVGRVAVRAAVAGARSKMVSLRPIGSEEACQMVPLTSVAGGEKLLPAGWVRQLVETGHSNELAQYLNPIVGELMNYPPLLKDSITHQQAQLQRQSS